MLSLLGSGRRHELELGRRGHQLRLVRCNLLLRWLVEKASLGRLLPLVGWILLGVIRVASILVVVVVVLVPVVIIVPFVIGLVSPSSPSPVSSTSSTSSSSPPRGRWGIWVRIIVLFRWWSVVDGGGVGIVVGLLCVVDVHDRYWCLYRYEWCSVGIVA